MTSRSPILTIGHSTHTLNEFIELLTRNSVGLVVDVRKLPGSRKFPHFNDDQLAVSLPEHGIGYVRIAGLTGRRTKQHNVEPDINGFWSNQSFHNYADYALTEEFAGALDQLINEYGQQRPALMCSEAVWWRCHRRIITDHLLARNIPVQHIISKTSTTDAQLNQGAHVADDATVSYPQHPSTSS